jgi:type VI protein secretion system component Hcp
MKKHLWLAVALLGAASTAHAASLYLHLPGITGEDSTPGYPDAMAIHAITITPNLFTINKDVDSASGQLFLAVANGTPFASSTALVYEGPPAAIPGGSVAFNNVLGSSYQIDGGGTTETVSFAADNPMSMFLVLPGIAGASSTPGYAGIMQIQSFSLTGSEFVVIKQVDSASPGIVSAVANGDLFASATILFYDALNPAGPPDAMLTFNEVLGSSYQQAGGDFVPLEEITFNFASIPEPASIGLLTLAGAALIRRRR